MDLKFSSPCSGCSKCFTDRLDLRKAQVEGLQKRWWHVFVRNFNPLCEIFLEFFSPVYFIVILFDLFWFIAQTPVTDYSKIENPSCGSLTEKSVNTVEVDISPTAIDEKLALRVNIGKLCLFFLL